MGCACGGKQLEVSVDGRIVGALGFSGFDPRLWVRTQPSIPRQVPAVQMEILKLGRVRMEADLQSEQIITNGIDNSYLWATFAHQETILSPRLDLCHYPVNMSD